MNVRMDKIMQFARVMYRRDLLLAAGTLTILTVVVFVCLGPFVLREDPSAISYVSEPLAPSALHWFGTDDLGRDVLLRIMYGGRVSLLVAFVAVAISLTIGTAVGAVAGFYGGWIDEVIMRGIDMLMAIPTIFLLLTVQVLLEPSIYNVMIIIGITGWMGVARIVRAEVLALTERDFVKAGRAFGFPDSVVLFRHILPNTLAPLFAIAVLGMGSAILTESALSYFGLGVQPPHPSWGNMLYNAQDYLLDAWWMTLFPGLFIVVTVLSLNFVGDGLYRVVNPQSGQHRR